MPAALPSPSFPILSIEEIQHLAVHGEEFWLETGDILFSEGEALGCLYIVLEGAIRIVKRVGDGEITLVNHQVGEFTGALGMLSGAPAVATARAVVRSRLLKLEAKVFKQVLVACPVLADTFISAMAHRSQELEASLQQREKLASLGALSAGLAHELNNPAAAGNRAASHLQEIFADLQTLAFRLNQLCQDSRQLEFLTQFQSEVLAQATLTPMLDPLAQSDREEEISDWLLAHGIQGAWKLAPALASAGSQTERLDILAANIAADSLGDVLNWLEAMLAGTGLLSTVKQSALRISELVGAIKEYSYMDQATQQEVDVHHGLDTTLVMLGHKLKEHATLVTRDYDLSLPRISVYGSELNQVWTNLIDNAIFAAGKQGKLLLHTTREDDKVMVEIGDNGAGVSPDVQAHIFEPFYTTKGVGEGSGLGLSIAYRIIAKHRGDIRVISVAGDTRFQVRLPVNSPGHTIGSAR